VKAKSFCTRTYRNKNQNIQYLLSINSLLEKPHSTDKDIEKNTLYYILTPTLKTRKSKMSIQVGDQIPSIEVSTGTPGNKVNMAELCAGKKVVLLAVPGAFTPGCSRTHLPGYVEQAEAIKGKGVDHIACIAVNDAFVMTEWGNAQGATGKIEMLADAQGIFTKEIGLDVQAAGLGGLRSKRYSMLIENGVVTKLNVEPNGFGLTCSLAPTLIEEL
jgi:2-Cys peroxiredoxin 5